MWSILIPLCILELFYSHRHMDTATNTQKYCSPTTRCSVCCHSSKSSLSPAPLIVIMLQMLCLFFLACTGGNINFRELNKHIQLFRMKDTDFPRHVVILRWQAMVREKKIKDFFIYWSECSLSLFLLQTQTRPFYVDPKGPECFALTLRLSSSVDLHKTWLRAERWNRNEM